MVNAQLRCLSNKKSAKEAQRIAKEINKIVSLQGGIAWCRISLILKSNNEIIDKPPQEYQYTILLGTLVVIMAKNTSMTLGTHFDEFINNQLEIGRFNSASEVVRAGLRLLENSETKLEVLRNLLKEGEESGVAEYDVDSFIAELDAQ